jgi:hypothetical protein
MLDLPYNQFTGTVQVMKAVGNHLVLTFCDTLPKSQIFTVILTKVPHMLSHDVSFNASHAMTNLISFHLTGTSIDQKSLETTRLERPVSAKSLQEHGDSGNCGDCDDGQHVDCFLSQLEGLKRFFFNF